MTVTASLEQFTPMLITVLMVIAPIAMAPIFPALAPGGMPAHLVME